MYGQGKSNQPTRQAASCFSTGSQANRCRLLGATPAHRTLGWWFRFSPRLVVCAVGVNGAAQQSIWLSPQTLWLPPCRAGTCTLGLIGSAECESRTTVVSPLCGHAMNRPLDQPSVCCPAAAAAAAPPNGTTTI